MKTKMMIMVVGMLMVCLLPLAANTQAQEWQSTSAMQGSGSTYSPQMNAIGAESAQPMATTTTATYSPTQGPNRARRSIEDDVDPGYVDPGSPIGDAAMPLMLMAVAFGGVVAFRRRREA